VVESPSALPPLPPDPSPTHPPATSNGPLPSVPDVVIAGLDVTTVLADGSGWFPSMLGGLAAGAAPVQLPLLPLVASPLVAPAPSVIPPLAAAPLTAQAELPQAARRSNAAAGPSPEDAPAFLTPAVISDPARTAWVASGLLALLLGAVSSRLLRRSAPAAAPVRPKTA